MADREKVIKWLNNEITHNEYWDEEYADCVPVSLLKDALELLKAQEPVDPAIGGNQNSCWYFICPRCQLAIDKGDKYCRHCGRAVKWE